MDKLVKSLRADIRLKLFILATNSAQFGSTMRTKGPHLEVALHLRTKIRGDSWMAVGRS